MRSLATLRASTCSGVGPRLRAATTLSHASSSSGFTYRILMPVGVPCPLLFVASGSYDMGNVVTEGRSIPLKRTRGGRISMGLAVVVHDGCGTVRRGAPHRWRYGGGQARARQARRTRPRRGTSPAPACRRSPAHAASMPRRQAHGRLPLRARFRNTFAAPLKMMQAARACTAPGLCAAARPPVLASRAPAKIRPHIISRPQRSHVRSPGHVLASRIAGRAGTRCTFRTA